MWNTYYFIILPRLKIDEGIYRFSSDNYISNSKGFSIYYNNKDYIGEFDIIKIRKNLIYDEI